MSISKNLQDIIIKQKTLLLDLEKQTIELERSDFAIENERLKRELEQSKKELDEHIEKLRNADFQNAHLKNALHEQIYNEKINIVNAAIKKNDVYFKAAVDGEMNKLSALEKDLKRKLSTLSDELKKNRVEAGNGLHTQLDKLSMEVNIVTTKARAKIIGETGAFSEQSHAEFERLKEGQITDDDINSIAKKNNWEAFIGGNLINKLGIFFVILGIIAVSNFTFTHLHDTFKGVVMFIISASFLVAGEFLNRRNSNIFSLGITSGGVAGLFASLSISYFALNIISMYPAIFLCVLITAGVFVLSLRYNSQTIASFALVGGYIPIISIGGNITLIYGAMVYFFILNILALSISFNRKWTIAMFIGFFLNLSGTIYICGNMAYTAGRTFAVHQLSTILYVLFAFAVYTIIPVMSNFRKKLSFSMPDIVVLSLNTVLSALVMYVVFIAFDLSKFNGLLAVVFAVTYIFLGGFVERKFASETSALALFYLTGLTFAVLTIPFQFGREWLSLGWLVQSVLLAGYGILKVEKRFKTAGFVIFGLCVAAFVYFDLLLSSPEYYLFPYKYFAVTSGSVILLLAFAYKRTMTGILRNVYKYAVLVNMWLYVIYAVYQLRNLFLNRFEISVHDADYIFDAMAITSAFLFAYFLPKIPLIVDKGVKIISVAISIIAIVWLIVLTEASGSIIRYDATVPLGTVVAASFVLIAVSILSVLAMRNVLMFFILEQGGRAEWLPFGVSAYFLILLSQNLICRYGLSVTSIAISLIYVTASFLWIVYGFMKRYVFMRRFGLGLCVLAVAKLFLIDLHWLTQGYKIISYFFFGAALLGISFVYQYFSKHIFKIEAGAEDCASLAKGDTDE